MGKLPVAYVRIRSKGKLTRLRVERCKLNTEDCTCGGGGRFTTNMYSQTTLFSGHFSRQVTKLLSGLEMIGPYGSPTFLAEGFQIHLVDE
jgi:hypothetical protein